jgi:hypothetical protein
MNIGEEDRITRLNRTSLYHRALKTWKEELLLTSSKAGCNND